MIKSDQDERFERDTMKKKDFIQSISCLLIVVALLALPATVLAQAPEPPPEWTGESEVSDTDILVFEPQFFFELPFAQGFQISFNLGISIRVPRQLMLVDNPVYNFFVRFRSFVIPGGVEAPTP
jgi:hypothetical protein